MTCWRSNPGFLFEAPNSSLLASRGQRKGRGVVQAPLATLTAQTRAILNQKGKGRCAAAPRKIMSKMECQNHPFTSVVHNSCSLAAFFFPGYRSCLPTTPVSTSSPLFVSPF